MAAGENGIRAKPEEEPTTSKGRIATAQPRSCAAGQPRSSATAAADNAAVEAAGRYSQVLLQERCMSRRD